MVSVSPSAVTAYPPVENGWYPSSPEARPTRTIVSGPSIRYTVLFPPRRNERSTTT